MKKISTLFKKDPNDLGLVINEINPENEWVYMVIYLPAIVGFVTIIHSAFKSFINKITSGVKQ